MAAAEDPPCAEPPTPPQNAENAAENAVSSNGNGGTDRIAHLTVDDLEEIQIELNNFLARKDVRTDTPIPAVLEGYLKLVAEAGSTFFPWAKVRGLFRLKLERVIAEFFESSPLDDIPLTPNVDAFNFNVVKDKVFEQLDAFAGIPFTVQRLAELLTAPKRHYKRTDKFMRALEKNMLVVSSVEPRSQNPNPPPVSNMPPNPPSSASPNSSTEPMINGSANHSTCLKPSDEAESASVTAPSSTEAETDKEIDVSGDEPLEENDAKISATAAVDVQEEIKEDAPPTSSSSHDEMETENIATISSSQAEPEASPVESSSEEKDEGKENEEEKNPADKQEASEGPCDSVKKEESELNLDENEANSEHPEEDKVKDVVDKKESSSSIEEEEEEAGKKEEGGGVDEMEVDAECSSSETKIIQ